MYSAPHNQANPFWVTDNPVFDPERPEERIIRRGGMFEHQRQWWNLPNFIKALVGGYGSGKTLIGSKRIIANALQNAPVPVMAVSPTYKMAKKTIIPTMKALLAGKKSIYPDLYYKFNGSDGYFTIKYHGRVATVWIGSGEDPDALKGANLASAWIDEPFIQVREVLHQMMARIRDPDARVKELLLTGTPEELNWGYDICEGEEEDNYDSGVVHAHTNLNLALDPQYVITLENAYDELAVEAYVGGGFVDLAIGKVYYGFSRDRNVKALGVPDGVELGVGMDFNVNPMAAAVFWRQGNHMHFFKEIELPNADTEYMMDYLTDEFGDRLRETYPDASGVNRSTKSPGGKSDFWYIEHAGYYINANNQNPHRKDRYNATNAKLNPKNAEPTVTIEPTCRKLIKYLSTYSHAMMNKQKEMSHLLDAYSYPIAYLFPIVHDTVEVHKLSGV